MEFEKLNGSCALNIFEESINVNSFTFEIIFYYVANLVIVQRPFSIVISFYKIFNIKINEWISDTTYM